MKRQLGPVVFFGNERLATSTETSVPILKSLIENDYEISAVISNYSPPHSRKTRPLEIDDVAKSHNIPLLLPSNLLSIKDEISSYKPAIGVLVAYGKIIPNDIINLFPRGIVNIHPSLLPKYRGPTPIEQVILDGVTTTGVSLMRLVKAMDSGPIYDQLSLKIVRTESKQELSERLLRLGKELLLQHLPDILKGSDPLIIQDENQATYTKLIEKNDGIINWRLSAMQLERQIRAFQGWPKSRTVLGGKEIVITKAQVINKSGKPGTLALDDQKRLIVYCGEQALDIQELILPAKANMTAQAFIAGYKNFLWTN